MPRTSGGVPAKPWISRIPRVLPRKRNGCSCAGSAGLLQTDFVTIAIKFAVYRPASSPRSPRLYEPGERLARRYETADRTWGGNRRMAIGGWLCALGLG